MSIQSIRSSAKQLKRNIAKLKAKDSISLKILKAIEKSERKLSKQLAILDSFGVSEKPERKPRKKKQDKFKFGDYRKYIKSTEWNARKASYYETHHRQCRSCGSDDKELHLHHRSYARIYQEEDGDLVPLCVDCHGMLHLFQRSFELPVEDATAMWLSTTNGNSNKRKIREALRAISFRQFESLWKRRSKIATLPARQLEKTIERLVKGDLGSREDAIPNIDSVKESIAFTKRTGDLSGYDAKVDALMRKLESM